jgi:hypothetical protein
VNPACADVGAAPPMWLVWLTLIVPCSAFRVASSSLWSSRDSAIYRCGSSRGFSGCVIQPSPTGSAQALAGCNWLNNGEVEPPPRRRVFWRRLFAWNLSELRAQGEPVAFEVWARVAGARELWTGERSIPVLALAAFGEGWLLTPELLGRSEETDDADAVSSRTA